MKPLKRLFKYGLITLVTLSFVSCAATLPNISPFSENTERMVSAIDHGYTQAETLLSVSDNCPGETYTLEKYWEQTNKTLRAVVSYSDAIVDLAEVAEKGDESAASLANALNGLVSTVGIGQIGSPFVGAFKELNKTISIVRARKSLKKAVSEAQPAIDLIAEIISANLTDLEKINNTAGECVEADHIKSNQLVVNYYNSLVKEDRKIIKILTLLLDYKLTRDTEYLDILKNSDPGWENTVGKDKQAIMDQVEKREKYWLERANSVRAEIDYYKPDYDAYNKELTEIQNLKENGSLVIRRSIIAIKSWAKAHGKLGIALEKKRRMSFREFTSVVQDVVKAYKKGGE